MMFVSGIFLLWGVGLQGGGSAKKLPVYSSSGAVWATEKEHL